MIADRLKRGEQNALHMEPLASLMEVSPRKLRKMIQTERRAGIVILSSPAGYYLPDDEPERAEVELKKYECKNRKSALGTLKTLRGTRAALRSLEGGTDGGTQGLHSL